ncbi:hypothetical protein [Agromyces indicus]|uniref:DUF222 domain-containing protein n=1 Tax=Agromyces indicus TaxID=758919 RepID=A0ABU1FH34_9MICO|nr:hypothetical protein [Agromyces indicus]MDR5691064.1 hypothetical protein [Agromyces indicus]
MTNYAEAIKQYRDAVHAAVTHTDDALTPDALEATRRQRVEQARASLLAARPTLPQPSETHDGVLDAKRARTADEIAVLQHEQAQVRAMLEAGQSLANILSNARPERALAIVDLVETLPEVLASTSRAEIIDETRLRAFDRLVELGDPDAVNAREVEQAAAAPLAWHRAMTETAESFDASISAMQEVYRLDPDAYEIARSGGGEQTARQLRMLEDGRSAFVAASD